MKAKLRGANGRRIVAADSVVCVMVPMNRDKLRAWDRHLKGMLCKETVVERIGGRPSAYLVVGPAPALAMFRARKHPYVRECIENVQAEVMGGRFTLTRVPTCDTTRDAAMLRGNPDPNRQFEPMPEIEAWDADAKEYRETLASAEAKAAERLDTVLEPFGTVPDDVRHHVGECLKVWFQCGKTHTPTAAELAEWATDNVDWE